MRKYPALGVPAVFLGLACLVLLYPDLSPLTAVSVAQQESVIQERAIKMNVPLHFPLTVMEVRNLQSDNFLRDMEIVIKNTSTKPICYIHTSMRLPDLIIPENGLTYAFPVIFGAHRLLIDEEIPSPEDPRINPGETYVLKIEKGIWKGFETYRSTHTVDPSATYRIQLIIQIFRFADGTGYNFSNYIAPGKTSKNHSPPKKRIDGKALKKLFEKSSRS
ncbi:MAG: hypothetical protein V7641_4143 [Blastocatellia bacterium]